MVSDRSLALYHELGRSGVGLVITGFAFVSTNGQALPGQYSVCTDQMVPGLRRIVDAVHHGGTKIAIQIVHAGINSDYLRRKGIETVGMSHLHGMDIPHREMTSGEIRGVIEDFARAAVRCREAGFDAIQLHSAHGYLLNQALSPKYNRRTDRWGGNPEKRRSLHIEIIKGIRREIGSGFPLLMKLGVMEDEEGGLSLEEGVSAAGYMVDAGLDAIEISAGDSEHVTPPALADGAEYTPFRVRAAAIKRVVPIPVIAVGGIRKYETAKSIIVEGDADMVAMCRPFIREPRLVARWRRGDRASAKCISCSRCMPVSRSGRRMRCAQNGLMDELNPMSANLLRVPKTRT